MTGWEADTREGRDATWTSFRSRPKWMSWSWTRPSVRWCPWVGAISDMVTDWEKESLKGDRHRRTSGCSRIKSWPQAGIVYLPSRKPSTSWAASKEAWTIRFRDVTLPLYSACIIPRESSKTNVITRDRTAAVPPDYSEKDWWPIRI